MKDGIYQHKEYKDLFRKIINNKLSKIAYNIYEARDAEMTYCPANPSCWDYVATLEMGVEEAHTEFIKQWLTYGANPEMNKWDYEHPLFTYHYLALNRCFACLVTPLKDSSHLDCSKCPINWGAKNCEQGGTLYSKWKMAPIGSTIRSALAYQIAHIKWDYDNGLKDGIYKSTLATYYRKVKNGTIYWGEEEIELAKQTKDILFNKGEAKTEMNNFYWCCPLSKEFDINETEEVKYEPVSVGDRFKSLLRSLRKL